MKALTLFLSALILLPVAAADKSPKTLRDEALKQATEAKKDLIMVFSGSSWNDASKELEKTILQSPEVKKEITRDFVQVLIDIPATRQEAGEELLEFEKSYQFRSIPTVILTDSLGRPYANHVPSEKDPAAFLKKIKELHQIRVERDKLLASALKAEGKKRAELLAKALQDLPQEIVPGFYPKELEMITKADPRNEYVGEIRKAEALKKEQARFNKLFQERKYDEVIKQSQAEGAKSKGEDAQRLKLYEVQARYAKKEYDQALKVVSALKEIDPESDLGKRSDQFAAQIAAAQKREERRKEAANKPRKPVVSKPVAIVTDIDELRKDVKKAQDEFAAAEAKKQSLVAAQEVLTKKISSVKSELETLQKEEEVTAEALKKATEVQEKMARKAKMMTEVLENHLAMEKRKREVSELEKQAAELQKEADKLRKKADKVRKGKSGTPQK